MWSAMMTSQHHTRVLAHLNGLNLHPRGFRVQRVPSNCNYYSSLYFIRSSVSERKCHMCVACIYREKKARVQSHYNNNHVTLNRTLIIGMCAVSDVLPIWPSKLFEGIG